MEVLVLSEKSPVKVFLVTVLLVLASSCAWTQENQKLQNLEVDCWHKNVEGGTFLCQFVIASGRIMDGGIQNGKLVFPEILAKDNGGASTIEQALRICRAMGFETATAYTLKQEDHDKLMMEIDEDLTSGTLSTSQDYYFQDVNCE